MNSVYDVTFNFYKGTKTMHFNGDIPLKEMFTQYANSIGESDQTMSSYVFLAEGKPLKTNSNETLQQTLSSQVTILVFDDDALGMDEKEEKNDNNSMDKINRNQFKSRNCRNSNKNIEGTLTDMAIFGCLTKKIMDNSTSIGANSFMSVNEAIQKGQNDSELFTLGIFGKYLCNLGINTVIDRNSGSINEKYVNLSNTILQFIFNGLIFKKKFYLYFSLNEKKIKLLFESEKQQKNFKDNVINAINELYNIPKKDIIVTNPVHDKYYLLMVLLKDDKIVLTQDQLIKQFQYTPDLCELVKVKKENIIEGIILNKCMLDPSGDNKDGGWEYYSKRGGEDYLPPEGWNRYGLNVFNKYDNRNNDWIMSDNRKGEWCIAYSWLGYGKNASNLGQKYSNEMDIKHKGKKVGNGIYCTQNPEIMNDFTEAINIKGKEYKLGLMLRVNPEKIRSPQSNDEIWVVDGYSDEIRPYGILIKEE